MSLAHAVSERLEHLAGVQVHVVVVRQGEQEARRCRGAGGDGQPAPQALGALLETFVVNELQKQLGWAQARARLFHFRSADRKEVDIVIENASGHIVGVEVRATSTLGQADFGGLRALQELAGERFVRGVVLHLGDAALAFGDRLEVAPVASLWLG